MQVLRHKISKLFVFLVLLSFCFESQAQNKGQFNVLVGLAPLKTTNTSGVGVQVKKIKIPQSFYIPIGLNYSIKLFQIKNFQIKSNTQIVNSIIPNGAFLYARNQGRSWSSFYFGNFLVTDDIGLGLLEINGKLGGYWLLNKSRLDQIDEKFEYRRGVISSGIELNIPSLIKKVTVGYDFWHTATLIAEIPVNGYQRRIFQNWIYLKYSF